MLEIQDKGANNSVSIDQQLLQRARGIIRLNGSNNLLSIQPFGHINDEAGTSLNIVIDGSGNDVRIGSCGSVGSLNIYASNGCELVIGAGTTINHNCSLLMHEPSRLHIGADCMIAGHVRVHTSDMHSVLDRATGQRINPAADIILEEHVWLGEQVTVSKGVRIGSGSIIGQGSVMTKNAEANSLWAGAPARCYRKGVTWDRRLIA